MSAPIPNPDSALVAALTTARAAEYVAICFHSHYERLAPDFGYATRPDSAVSWAQVPEQNRRLMIATAGHVIRDILDLVAPIDGSVDKNPNQGRGADLVRTEGEGGSRSAADASSDVLFKLLDARTRACELLDLDPAGHDWTPEP